VSDELGARLAAELDGRSLLEVGVGTARISAPLVRRGISVVGVDVSLPMLRRAVDKGLTAGLVADGAHLPFREDSFDAAITVHLTHLLVDWAHVLQEISRVTRTEYVSVLEGPERRGGPASEYYRSLAEEGISAAHPGVHEQRLAEELPPDRWLEPIEYTDTTSTEATLQILEHRQWSNQWNVPEGPHRRALQRARARFPTDWKGVDTYRVRIAVWSIPRLAKHVARSRAARSMDAPTRFCNLIGGCRSPLSGRINSAGGELEDFRPLEAGNLGDPGRHSGRRTERKVGPHKVIVNAPPFG